VKHSTAVAIHCLPEQRGFWFEIAVSRTVKYKVRYFALGTAGHQRQGELQGTARVTHYRRFIELGFPIVVVGITDLNLLVGRGSIRGHATPFVSVAYGVSRVSPGKRITGGGRIELFPAARKQREESSGGTYGDAYGAYGAYGTYLYGGISESTQKTKKEKSPLKSKRGKTGGKRRN
jgi:hypothetical protein